MKSDVKVSWTLFALMVLLVVLGLWSPRQIADFLNSAFFDSLLVGVVGAGAAAFAGAYGAQQIADRNKRRDDLSKELRDTNVAIMIAYEMCNTLVSFKKQFAKPLREQFSHDREKVVHAFASRTRASVGLNFQEVQPVSPPALSVRQIVLERLSIVGRPLVAATKIPQIIEQLNAIILARNDLIAKFRSRDLIPEDDRAAMYFGLRLPSGRGIDSSFSDTVEGCYILTDSAIYYTRDLITDLVAHGLAIGKTLKEKFDEKVRVHTPDFSDAERAGLIPDEADFQEWRAAFKQPKSDA